MSLGRRLLNMARAELNSLLDLAAKRGDNDDDAFAGGYEDESPLNDYTASELREEIERRQQAQREVDEALRRDRGGARPGAGSSSRAAGGRPTPMGPTAGAVQSAYAALEVPIGSDFETVRKAYRTLMRKYHPDHHTATPEKQRDANKVAQRLTEAYKLLEARLRR